MTKSEMNTRIDGFIRFSPVKIVKQIHANVEQMIMEEFFTEVKEENSATPSTNTIIDDVRPNMTINAVFSKSGNKVHFYAKIFNGTATSQGLALFKFKNNLFIPRTGVIPPVFPAVVFDEISRATGVVYFKYDPFGYFFTQGNIPVGSHAVINGTYFVNDN